MQQLTAINLLLSLLQRVHFEQLHFNTFGDCETPRGRQRPRPADGRERGRSQDCGIIWNGREINILAFASRDKSNASKLMKQMKSEATDKMSATI